MKRPLAGVASSYTAGLLLGKLFQPPLALLFVVAFTCLMAALVFSRWRYWLLWPLLILSGWTNLVCHTVILSPFDLRHVLGREPAAVLVHGTLAETPHLKIQERRGEAVDRSLAQVQVTEISLAGTWRPAAGTIVVTTPGSLDSVFFAGQPVEISGVIAPPSPPLAQGLFDYREYLATRGIYFELKARSTNDWKTLAPEAPARPLSDRFLSWSKQTLASNLPAEDEPLRLLWAMTLGWRTAFTGEISEPFLRAGTMHMFAIDGLRIALLSGMLVMLLRTIRLSRAWCGAVAVPLIWFYTAATGWESSAIRASVMMTIVLGGWALMRPSDTINSLAAAGLVILFWDPCQLFEASFQLSFFVVLTLLLILPPLNQLLDRWLQPDPLLPFGLRPRWQQTLFVALRPIAHFCALSFVAWIGSLPLSIKYFHLFSPVSTLANVFAVPLGALALMANLGALVCGTWFSLATGLFNQAAWFFMSAMTWVSEAATQIPGAYFYVPDISWITIGLYYGGIIAVFGGWFNTRRKRVFGLGALILLSAFYVGRWALTWNETDLTVLPLNGGHAIYVDAPGRKNDWLVDCGNANAIEFDLKPFLRAQGVNFIPRLALTDGEARNCGGALALDRLFGIGELQTTRTTSRSKIYKQIVTAFEQSPGRHHYLSYGDTLGPWQVLHPGSEDTPARADNHALVLLGHLSGTKILLLSDLGKAGQYALLSQTNDLHADIVVTGLPTEDEPLNNKLLAAIQPKIIIVVDSEYPPQSRAGYALKERLGQSGIRVIYTSSAGAVKIVTHRNGWSLETMDGQKLDGTSD